MDTAVAQDSLLTLEETSERSGISVRNIRFYTSRGLVPPPLRHGRSGFYSAEHLARLELVRELQKHGFTLAAIEKYVARIPDDATSTDIALHLALLAPVPEDGTVDIHDGLLELGVSAGAADAVAEVYARHGQQVAAELSDIVRTRLWPDFRDAGGTVEGLRELIRRLKPLTVAGLIAAYEQAMDESADSHDRRGSRSVR